MRRRWATPAGTPSRASRPTRRWWRSCGIAIGATRQSPARRRLSSWAALERERLVLLSDPATTHHTKPCNDGPATHDDDSQRSLETARFRRAVLLRGTYINSSVQGLAGRRSSRILRPRRRDRDHCRSPAIGRGRVARHAPLPARLVGHRVDRLVDCTGSCPGNRAKMTTTTSIKISLRPPASTRARLLASRRRVGAQHVGHRGCRARSRQPVHAGIARMAPTSSDQGRERPRDRCTRPRLRQSFVDIPRQFATGEPAHPRQCIARSLASHDAEGEQISYDGNSASMVASRRRSCLDSAQSRAKTPVTKPMTAAPTASTTLMLLRSAPMRRQAARSHSWPQVPGPPARGGNPRRSRENSTQPIDVAPEARPPTRPSITLTSSPSTGPNSRRSSANGADVATGRASSLLGGLQDRTFARATGTTAISYPRNDGLAPRSWLHTSTGVLLPWLVPRVRTVGRNHRVDVCRCP